MIKNVEKMELSSVWQLVEVINLKKIDISSERSVGKTF